MDDDNKNGKLIMEMHSIAGDRTPMQMISLALLAHYRACEAELMALKAGKNPSAIPPTELP